VLNERLTTSQDPSVHDVGALWRIVVNDEFLASGLLEKLDLTQVEVEGIDPLEDHVGQNLPNTFLSESQVLTSHDRRVHQEKTDTVGSVLVDDLQWIGVVLQTFAHLLTVADIRHGSLDPKKLDSRSKNKTGGDEVLPWSSIEELGTQHKQGVEPTTSLVNTFGNEVRWVGLFVTLSIFERVMVRCVWHTDLSAE